MSASDNFSFIYLSICLATLQKYSQRVSIDQRSRRKRTRQLQQTLRNVFAAICAKPRRESAPRKTFPVREIVSPGCKFTAGHKSWLISGFFSLHPIIIKRAGSVSVSALKTRSRLANRAVTRAGRERGYAVLITV